MANPRVEQITTSLTQGDKDRLLFVWFVSSSVGFLFYALSTYLDLLHGKPNLLMIIIYGVIFFFVYLAIFFPKHLHKRHFVFLVLELTTVYSFYNEEHQKPNAFSLFSSASFAIMSLCLSKLCHSCIEHDFLYFYCTLLTIQCMKRNRYLFFVGAIFNYFLIMLCFNWPEQEGQNQNSDIKDNVDDENYGNGDILRNYLLNIFHPQNPQAGIRNDGVELLPVTQEVGFHHQPLQDIEDSQEPVSSESSPSRNFDTFQKDDDDDDDDDDDNDDDNDYGNDLINMFRPQNPQGANRNDYDDVEFEPRTQDQGIASLAHEDLKESITAVQDTAQNPQDGDHNDHTDNDGDNDRKNLRYYLRNYFFNMFRLQKPQGGSQNEGLKESMTAAQNTDAPEESMTAAQNTAQNIRQHAVGEEKQVFGFDKSATLRKRRVTGKEKVEEPSMKQVFGFDKSATLRKRRVTGKEKMEEPSKNIQEPQGIEEIVEERYLEKVL